MPTLRLCLKMLPLWGCVERDRAAAQTHGTGELYAAKLLLTMARPKTSHEKETVCLSFPPNYRGTVWHAKSHPRGQIKRGSPLWV